MHNAPPGGGCASDLHRQHHCRIVDRYKWLSPPPFMCTLRFDGAFLIRPHQHTGKSTVKEVMALVMRKCVDSTNPGDFARVEHELNGKKAYCFVVSRHSGIAATVLTSTCACACVFVCARELHSFCCVYRPVACTHTHKHTHTRTRTHSHTNTHTHIHILSLSLTHTHAYAHTHRCSHTHTSSLSLSLC